MEGNIAMEAFMILSILIYVVNGTKGLPSLTQRTGSLPGFNNREGDPKAEEIELAANSEALHLIVNKTSTAIPIPLRHKESYNDRPSYINLLTVAEVSKRKKRCNVRVAGSNQCGFDEAEDTHTHQTSTSTTSTKRPTTPPTAAATKTTKTTTTTTTTTTQLNSVTTVKTTTSQPSSAASLSSTHSTLKPELATYVRETVTGEPIPNAMANTIQTHNATKAQSNSPISGSTETFTVSSAIKRIPSTVDTITSSTATMQTTQSIFTSFTTQITPVTVIPSTVLTGPKQTMLSKEPVALLLSPTRNSLTESMKSVPTNFAKYSVAESTKSERATSMSKKLITALTRSIYETHVTVITAHSLKSISNIAGSSNVTATSEWSTPKLERFSFSNDSSTSTKTTNPVIKSLGSDQTTMPPVSAIQLTIPTGTSSKDVTEPRGFFEEPSSIALVIIAGTVAVLGLASLAGSFYATKFTPNAGLVNRRAVAPETHASEWLPDMQLQLNIPTSTSVLISIPEPVHQRGLDF